MERANANGAHDNSTDNPQNQGVKRRFENEAQLMSHGPWKNTSDLHRMIPNRKPTFANDRLKRLRTEINNDIKPLIINTNRTELKETSASRALTIETKYPERKHIVPYQKLVNVRRPIVSMLTSKSTRYSSNFDRYNQSNSINKKRNLPTSLQDSPENSNSYKTRKKEIEPENSRSRLRVDESGVKATCPVSLAYDSESRTKSSFVIGCTSTKSIIPLTSKKYLNPVNIARKTNSVHKGETSKSGEDHDIEHSSSKFLGRTVETKKGLLSISVTNKDSKNNNESKTSNAIKFSPLPKCTPESNSKSFDDRLSTKPELRCNLEEKCLRKENRSALYTPTSIKNSYVLNSYCDKFSKSNLKSSSPIQERLQRNRFSNNGTPNRTSSVSISKPSQTLSVSNVPSFSRDQESRKQFIDPTPSTSSSYTSDQFERSSNYWINYGQIVNALYKKFFSSDLRGGNVSNVTRANNVQENSFTDTDDVMMDWEDDDTVEHSLVNPPTSNLRGNQNKELYFVVDTNVLLSELNLLKEFICSGSSGGTKPILYIPWMVLSELDFMKDDNGTSSDLKRKSQDAVNFINKTLLEGGKNVIGQNVFEVDDQKYVGKSPDDKIVSCCLQGKEKFRNVMLLSNDVNLRNKILVNGIPALSMSEILKISRVSSNESPSDASGIQGKMEKVLAEMSNCCSFIICETAKESYGHVWNKMNMLNNPPWPLKRCLRIFNTYWRGAFRDKLLKQCLKTLEQLDIVLRVLESSRSEDTFNEFVKVCITLCIYFKDLRQHKSFVEGTITAIRGIANSP